MVYSKVIPIATRGMCNRLAGRVGVAGVETPVALVCLAPPPPQKVNTEKKKKDG